MQIIEDKEKVPMNLSWTQRASYYRFAATPGRIDVFDDSGIDDGTEALVTIYSGQCSKLSLYDAVLALMTHAANLESALKAHMTE